MSIIKKNKINKTVPQDMKNNINKSKKNKLLDKPIMSKKKFKNKSSNELSSQKQKILNRSLNVEEKLVTKEKKKKNKGYSEAKQNATKERNEFVSKKKSSENAKFSSNEPSQNENLLKRSFNLQEEFVTKKMSKDEKQKDKAITDKLESKKNGEENIKCSSNSKQELKKIPQIGFQWEASIDDLSVIKSKLEDDSDEDHEEVEAQKIKPKLSKADKLAAAKEAEAKIRRAEEELLRDGDPVSAEQFDRLLLAQPNNSELWVKYMAHHLQATEIEKARAVARRALTVINIRHEEDRLNVWTSLLNLEHLYGTPDSLHECLSEAVRCNDDVKIYSKMAEIYAGAGQIRELEATVKTLLKKAGQNHSSLGTWLKCANLLLKIGQKDSARHLLQRGLNALPATLHLQLITRFALLENAHGDAERAQALFEHTLTTYPARVDVWSVYVDMLVKSNRVDLARQVLQRSVSQKLAPKKLKPLYSKWLKIEEQHGDESCVQSVKREIENYVQNANAALKNHR